MTTEAPMRVEASKVEEEWKVNPHKIAILTLKD